MRSRIFFLLFGTACGLLVAELCFLIVLPKPRLFYGPESWRENILNTELSWQPVVGGEHRHALGYLRKESRFSENTPIIALIGDSVTAQNYVATGFSEGLEDRVSVLNFGVPGYNSQQAVAYFEQFALDELEPKIVTLLLHPNDFFHSVVAVSPEPGRLVYVNSLGTTLRGNTFLAKNSNFYQFLVQAYLMNNANQISGEMTVKKSLERFAYLSSKHGFSPYVIVLPVFQPIENWSVGDRNRNELMLELLRSVKIAGFDCLPLIEEASFEGQQIAIHTDDPHHPGYDFGIRIGRRFAAWLLENGHFDPQ